MRTDLRVRTDRPLRVSLARDSIASLSSRPALLHLAAEEHVLDDVEVVAQREVLVDDLDPERVAVARAGHRDRLLLEGVLALVEGVDAGDPLDQGALAGTVVADQGGDPARM